MIKGDLWMNIRNDYLKGIPINEIARKYAKADKNQFIRTKNQDTKYLKIMQILLMKN